MNILILVNKPPFPPNDGGAFATLNMALGLVDAGAKVTLLTMSTPKHPTEAASFPEDIRRKMVVKTVFVNTRLSPLKALSNLLFSKHAYNAQRFISKQYAQELKSLLVENSYDIVQLEGLYMYPYISLIKQYHKGKLSLRAHNVEHEIWYRNASIQKSRLKRWYFKLLARRVKRAEVDVLKQLDFLVPISVRDEKQLKSMGYSGLSFTSPTGYRLNMATGSSKDYEFPSIFHLGSLDWIPNQEGIAWFLENCWAQVIAAITNAKFYVAGRNASQEIMELIAQYPNAVFVGEVEDAADFMNSKAVMIVPLFSGSGMRIKIVEGMALGKAIVTTTIGVEGIDAIHGEHLIIADDPNLMAESIIELFENSKKIEKLGRNAQEFVSKHLDNKSLTAQLYQFYSHNQ